jgi:hypothetical protein
MGCIGACPSKGLKSDFGINSYSMMSHLSWSFNIKLSGLFSDLRTKNMVTMKKINVIEHTMTPKFYQIVNFALKDGKLTFNCLFLTGR